MTLQEIKDAIADGKRVFWKNEGYEVLKSKGCWEYMIVFHPNGNCIGLTWQDGKTMNGEEEDFFVKP